MIHKIKTYSRAITRWLVAFTPGIAYLLQLLPSNKLLKCSTEHKFFSYGTRGFFSYIARYSKNNKPVNSMVTMDYQGIQFVMNLNLNEYTQCGYYFSCPNPDLMALIKKGGDVFIDVGANVGVFSILAANTYKSVISFEPGKRAKQQLHKNISDNHVRNIKVIEKAVSDSSGSMTLHENPINLGGSSLQDFPTEYIDSMKDREWLEYEVDIVSLDEYFKDYPVDSIGMIKIDVEGHEVSVLKGAVQIIKKYQPLLYVEAHTEDHFHEIYNVLPETYNAWDPVSKIQIPQQVRQWKYLNVLFSIEDPFVL